MQHEVLVVDDEADIRYTLCGILEDFNYKPLSAKNYREAIQLYQEKKPSLCLLDIWLGDQRSDGLNLLDEMNRIDAVIPKIMISGHSNIETAVNSIKRGAFDFIEKPFQTDRLLLTVSHAVESYYLKRKNAELSLQLPQETSLIGVSSQSKQLKSLVKKISGTKSRVFITGATGVGKEHLAKVIHNESKRSEGPFITLNCASLSPDNVEQTLFGEETDHHVTLGALEKAHKGTLYLDEITEMPLQSQAKVMKAFAEPTFKRVGGETPIQVDVRIISSTSADVEKAIQNKRLREDLYYRLNIVPVHVDSLAERREDIPLLLEHFMENYFTVSPRMKKRHFSREALRTIQQYDWPGNIRQLKNLADWLMIMSAATHTSNVIQKQDLPPEITSAGKGAANIKSVFPKELMGMPLREAREYFEKDYLSNQIKRFNGNISQMASFIGMERSALHRKLKMLSIVYNEEKVPS